MDSSSGSENGETLKLISHDVGGISPRDVELETTSIGSNGESLPRNYDGYAMQYEMDLFEKSQYSATTSSYSSSDKYSEDYFQVRPTDMTKIDKDVLDFLENGNAATIAMSSSSTEPMSMVSDITHESLMHGLSPAQSPPQVQLMDRLGGYQPGRIPASVFESSPSSTPAEWSIASNDSLFSIHIGNISFTRDQFVLSEELRKSVELAHFDEAVSTTQPQEYDDGPIAELEKNFQANENATRMSISIEEKRDDPFATSTTPSVNDKHHINLSMHPIKKKSSGSWCLCPKPVFRWLRKICCWIPACCHCGWPSCHCQCPILDCKCSCLTCCLSSCDWSCCSKECCSCCFSSKRSDTESKSSSSCCTCSGCWALSSLCNPCCSSCFSCRRKSRCCC